MLIEKYNKKTNEYECYSSDMKWVAFTGYGDTREAARISYFKINVVKNPVQLFNAQAI